ncbi:DUF1800 family protein, partial [Acinetobacter baumannii]
LNPLSIPVPDSLAKTIKALDVSSQSAGSVLSDYQQILKDTKDESETSQKKRRALIWQIVEETAEERLYRALESPRQLQEVMVDFWFNH